MISFLVAKRSPHDSDFFFFKKGKKNFLDFAHKKKTKHVHEDKKKIMTSVILTMTSIPSRLHRLPNIINALLHKQTFAFDRLILYLPFYCVRQKTQYVIPEELFGLQQNGRFEIRRCDVDDGPATKIIPAMHDFASNPTPCVVISVDDDVFLEPHAIEELVNTHKCDPVSILGFMGVIAPLFFHGDVIHHQTLEVTLLGGYRAILYPQCVFASFVSMFRTFQIKKPLSSSWPFPVIDDDYFLSQIARWLRVSCKVVRSGERRADRTLNIQFDHNSDGVSGQTGANCFIQPSRAMIDVFFEQKQQLSLEPFPIILHIVCGSSFEKSSSQKIAHFDGRVITRYARHHKFNTGIIHVPTLVVYLMRLFHPTVRDAPLSPKIQKVKYILISHSDWYVDFHGVFAIAQWHASFEIFPPSLSMIVATDRECHGQPVFLFTRNQIASLCCDVKQQLSLESQSIIITNTRDPIDIKWDNLPCTNLAGVICVLSSDNDRLTLLQKHWKRRQVWKPVRRVFYGTKDITANIRTLCTHHKLGWRCDGTNAQMDIIFGDPTPCVAKCINIELQNGRTLQQNTDWLFSLRQQHLMVQ